MTEPDDDLAALLGRSRTASRSATPMPRSTP